MPQIMEARASPCCLFAAPGKGGGGGDVKPPEPMGCEPG